MARNSALDTFSTWLAIIVYVFAPAPLTMNLSRLGFDLPDWPMIGWCFLYWLLVFPLAIALLLGFFDHEDDDDGAFHVTDLFPKEWPLSLKFATSLIIAVLLLWLLPVIFSASDADRV